MNSIKLHLLAIVIFAVPTIYLIYLMDARDDKMENFSKCQSYCDDFIYQPCYESPNEICVKEYVRCCKECEDKYGK